MSRVRLTPGQAYWLACARENKGTVSTWDGAPSQVTVVLDGVRRTIRDAHATKQEANGLAKRGLFKEGRGWCEITKLGEAALALRKDLLLALADKSDAAHAKMVAASDAADAEYYAARAKVGK